ncbi:heterokaryon incompatibility protein-domain-containing protein [Colletotrichum phormii]|uniref:Heterokaryon incompatibility protein-domain-containing protein n=1 Tax=Colletotrichum phormii TaxID=359342 RepID=A0AAI9ZM43_9PEZI|nr:heterokaryon incompatibility protein-domain-containing protein [Colletotrichum phormii]KAK1634505.1 heterokaryon incompatibility protein-domain-containing protein [Colletotrichum phormii]
MDSGEAEEFDSSINDRLCDVCWENIVLDDSGEEFYEGTSCNDEPTLRHSGEGDDGIFLEPIRFWRDTLPDLPMMAESSAAGCRYRYEIFDTDPGWALWRCEVYAVEPAIHGLDKRIGALYFDIESSNSAVHRKTAPEPLDPASVEWLQLQLRGCNDDCDHGKPESPFLPTRLIHVGQNEDDLPRLVIVENMLNSCTINGLEYAALTYCWGSKEEALKQAKTIKDTISTHCQGVPLSSLSPVVRDTIKVCRALGILYLWVDTFCIIQGDNVDWDRESRMMGQIYSSCYVTICPLSSRSCLQGYLGPRPQGLEVEFQSSRHEYIRETYRLVFSSIDIDADPRWAVDRRPAQRKDLDKSSWNKRGWTFQESILSPHMICFGPNMSHFVCENLIKSENGYIDRKVEHGKLQVIIRRALGRPYNESDRSVNSMASVYEHWDSVRVIQRRVWTYREDIFPGLAGIAQAFAAITGDTYLAGLWEHCLHHELIWYMPRPPVGDLASLLHSLQHADPYIAPSWSWASQTTYQEDVVGWQQRLRGSY